MIRLVIFVLIKKNYMKVNKLIYALGLMLLLNSCEKDNPQNNTNDDTKDTLTADYSLITMRIHRDIEELDWPWDYVIKKEGNEELINIESEGEQFSLDIIYESNSHKKPLYFISGRDTSIWIKYDSQDDIKSIRVDDEGIANFKRISPSLMEMYQFESEDGIDSNLYIGNIYFENDAITSIEYVKDGDEPLFPTVSITGSKSYKSTFSQNFFSLFTMGSFDSGIETFEDILISYYNPGGYFLMFPRDGENPSTNVDPAKFDVTLNESGYPTRIDYDGIRRIWTATYQ
ncbi:hypothetical protein N9Y33_01355 [Bacteroidia bacterium]|nr:hypothetical protein [Bacteroidia bacterium]